MHLLPIAVSHDASEINKGFGSRNAGFFHRLPSCRLDKRLPIAWSPLGDAPRNFSAGLERGSDKEHLERVAVAAVEKQASRDRKNMFLGFDPRR